jgi:ribonuclease HII
MPRRKKEAVEKPPEPVVPPAPPVPTWDWEKGAWADGWELVAGVDEAGRGPLAGPVVAAAVILPREIELEGLRDSKIVPHELREELYVRILDVALSWSVCAVDREDIDRINILQATYRAMSGALSGLDPTAQGALVDGLPVKGLPCPHKAIVDGDAHCISIAAASILAKVTRDRMMVELDAVHPGYGFAQHKGYSTPEHYEALRRLGPTPIHRRSFRPIAAFYETQASLPLGD